MFIRWSTIKVAFWIFDGPPKTILFCLFVCLFVFFLQHLRNVRGEFLCLLCFYFSVLLLCFLLCFGIFVCFLLSPDTHSVWGLAITHNCEKWLLFKMHLLHQFFYNLTFIGQYVTVRAYSTHST